MKKIGLFLLCICTLLLVGCADKNNVEITVNEGSVLEFEAGSTAVDFTSYFKIKVGNQEVSVTTDMIESNVNFNKPGKYIVKLVYTSEGKTYSKSLEITVTSSSDKVNITINSTLPKEFLVGTIDSLDLVPYFSIKVNNETVAVTADMITSNINFNNEGTYLVTLNYDHNGTIHSSEFNITIVENTSVENLANALTSLESYNFELLFTMTDETKDGKNTEYDANYKYKSKEEFLLYQFDWYGDYYDYYFITDPDNGELLVMDSERGTFTFLANELYYEMVATTFIDYLDITNINADDFIYEDGYYVALSQNANAIGKTIFGDFDYEDAVTTISESFTDVKIKVKNGIVTEILATSDFVYILDDPDLPAEEQINEEGTTYYDLTFTNHNQVTYEVPEYEIPQEVLYIADVYQLEDNAEARAYGYVCGYNDQGIYIYDGQTAVYVYTGEREIPELKIMGLGVYTEGLKQTKDGLVYIDCSNEELTELREDMQLGFYDIYPANLPNESQVVLEKKLSWLVNANMLTVTSIPTELTLNEDVTFGAKDLYGNDVTVLVSKDVFDESETELHNLIKTLKVGDLINLTDMVVGAKNDEYQLTFMDESMIEIVETDPTATNELETALSSLASYHMEMYEVTPEGYYQMTGNYYKDSHGFRFSIVDELDGEEYEFNDYLIFVEGEAYYLSENDDKTYTGYKQGSPIYDEYVAMLYLENSGALEASYFEGSNGVYTAKADLANQVGKLLLGDFSVDVDGSYYREIFTAVTINVVDNKIVSIQCKFNIETNYSGEDTVVSVENYIIYSEHGKVVNNIPKYVLG